MKPYHKYNYYIQKGKITHAIEEGISNNGFYGSEKLPKLKV